MAEYSKILQNYFFIRHYNDDLTSEQKANLKKLVDKKDADKKTIQFYNNLKTIKDNSEQIELDKLIGTAGVNELKDLYKDLLVVFENIRKDKQKSADDLFHDELHKDVIAFGDKYDSIFERQPIPVGTAPGQINITNLKNWIDNLPLSIFDGRPLKRILNESGYNETYIKLKKALDESERKNKITDEALNLLKNVFNQVDSKEYLPNNVLNIGVVSATVRDLSDVLEREKGGQLNIINLENWIDNTLTKTGRKLEVEDKALYDKLRKELDNSKRKNQMTEEAPGLLKQALDYFNETDNIPSDVLELRTVNVSDFLNTLDFGENINEDKLDEFRGKLKEILDTIYSKSKVSDYVASHGGSDIIDAKTKVKERDDFSNIPNNYKYESGIDKLKKKIKEDKERTIYKLEQRHYRHSYLNANAKSIVSSLIKKKITPDQGLDAWIKEKDAIINSVSPAAKDDCTKMFKFFEKVKASDGKLISKALSHPDRLDALVSFLIKDAVNGTDGMSVGTAKAIMESLFIMRYRLFDFADRGSKMKEFWDSKTQLVGGMSLFKGNKGAEFIGKMTDWSMKLCMSAVINGYALLRHARKSVVKDIRRTGEKNIENEKLENSSKEAQIQELWEYWNSIDKEDGFVNILPFTKIKHRY